MCYSSSAVIPALADEAVEFREVFFGNRRKPLAPGGFRLRGLYFAGFHSSLPGHTCLNIFRPPAKLQRRVTVETRYPGLAAVREINEKCNCLEKISEEGLPTHANTVYTR